MVCRWWIAFGIYEKKKKKKKKNGRRGGGGERETEAPTGKAALLVRGSLSHGQKV